jgi:hypothetical protein
VILAMEGEGVMPMDEFFLDNGGYILYMVPYVHEDIYFISARISDFLPGLPLFFLRHAKR